MLFYATGGWAWGRGTILIGGVSSHQTHSGWVLGLGAEYGITQNVTARVEYLRLNLGAETYATIVGPIRTDLDAGILRLGLNYKF
jgi:outer membrane immunogenic protein